MDGLHIIVVEPLQLVCNHGSHSVFVQYIDPHQVVSTVALTMVQYQSFFMCQVFFLLYQWLIMAIIIMLRHKACHWTISGISAKEVWYCVATMITIADSSHKDTLLAVLKSNQDAASKDPCQSTICSCSTGNSYRNLYLPALFWEQRRSTQGQRNEETRTLKYGVILLCIYS